MKLRTERLLLRQLVPADATALFVYRSDEETNKYLSLQPKTVDDVKAFIRSAAVQYNKPGTWFQFGMVLESTHILIGDIGVHFLANDTDNKQVEVGFTLHPDYRGKGYASEALTAVIDDLFTRLKKHRIVASVDPANTASRKLLENLGFRKEAHFVESLYFHGEWVDDMIYALLAEEW